PTDPNKSKDYGEEESDDKAKETEPQQQEKQAWAPTTYSKFGKEVFCYVGQEISIFEALDSYGAVIWPAALALCHYLETNVEQVNLVDKAVLELGAGPGLVSIVATLLGAWVTATDLPEIIGNLRANLLRNTRGRCRSTPQAAALSWGPDVERTYPSSVYRYDYVLAADVVYHHDYLEELLFTMRYFCRPGTTLIWANKVRLKTDLSFTEDFQDTFNTTLLAEMGEVNIFMGTCRETEEEPELVPGKQQEEEEEEHVTECLQEEENGLEEKEEEFKADETTENEEEDETQKNGLKEENKDRENQEDSQDRRDDEEQQNSAGSRSTSESELGGLGEHPTYCKYSKYKF
uniref:Si:ch73-244f7.3 n=1 Tax=Salmo trutta TaxID=8032 RepID=A0A674BX68_SALTR